MIRYFPTAGDKHGWAIDEDRRLIRSALAGVARESSICLADVVHTPFWMALDMHSPAVLHRRFVIAHADNPPFFYLTQPAFARGQELVDLWVARSRESQGQFEALGCESVHIPYAIDETLFFPMADRKSLRSKYHLPADAYVVGNFHRDTEGADLSRPKLQKAPEMLLAILRRVRSSGVNVHVLLAGPRRHWLREALKREQIPFTFVGRDDVYGDDFGVNILSRTQLNELYNACDLYVIPSRWEGGPQSVMEAAATRTKVLSIPLGVGRDILEPASMFDLASEAAALIKRDAEDAFLGATLDAQAERLHTNHTMAAMAHGLHRLYESLGDRPRFSSLPPKRIPADGFQEALWLMRRRIHRSRLPESIQIRHEAGLDDFLDEAVSNLRKVCSTLGIEHNSGRGEVVIAGKTRDARSPDFRLLTVGGHDEDQDSSACRIALSVQDAVNFRKMGGRAPIVVCPLFLDSSLDGEGSLLVAEDDIGRSLDVWKAILGRQVPVYPSGSNYYWQAFHGGVPYGPRRTQDEAEKISAAEADEISSLARPPTMAAAVRFFRDLLSR